MKEEDNSYCKGGVGMDGGIYVLLKILHLNLLKGNYGYDSFQMQMTWNNIAKNKEEKRDKCLNGEYVWRGKPLPLIYHLQISLRNLRIKHLTLRDLDFLRDYFYLRKQLSPHISLSEEKWIIEIKIKKRLCTLKNRSTKLLLN